MRQDQQRGPLEPQDVEELLPWYVTGRLSREEARGIEAALKTMPDLAGKLARVQRERDAVSRASEAIESAPPETLQRLLEQVETTRQWRAPRLDSGAESGGWLKSAMSRSVVWQTAFAAACVAIVAMGIQAYSPPAPGEFGVASSINQAGGASLLVTFQPDASVGEIAALLTGLEATIVDGPKPGGTYVVRIPATQAGEVDAATNSLLMRKDLVVEVLRGQ